MIIIEEFKKVSKKFKMLKYLNDEIQNINCLYEI